MPSMSEVIVDGERTFSIKTDLAEEIAEELRKQGRVVELKEVTYKKS